MSKTRPTRIVLKADENAIHEEGVAAATITPGDLIALNSDSELIPHSSAGHICEKAFALEDALQGRTIEDDYSDGELVAYHIGRPGDVILAWLADGQNVAAGDQLQSHGDGTLSKVTGSNVALAIALEAMDLSLSDNTEAARIRVRLL